MPMKRRMAVSRWRWWIKTITLQSLWMFICPEWVDWRQPKEFESMRKNQKEMYLLSPLQRQFWIGILKSANKRVWTVLLQNRLPMMNFTTDLKSLLKTEDLRTQIKLDKTAIRRGLT